jgi:membrane-bound serine protease (ClpP class)
MHPGGVIGAALPVVPAQATEKGGLSRAFQAADAKVISALAAQMAAAAEAKGHPTDAAVAMVNPDKPLAGFGEPGEMLTLTASQARDIGLAAVKAETLEGFLVDMGLGDAQVIRPELTTLEKTAAQLSRPMFASLLMGLALILLILEAKSPGIGFPLVGSIVCFGLAQYGSMMADLSGTLEPILLIVGFGLIMLELFVIPGFGVAGVAGGACVILSIAFSMNNMPSTAMGIMQYWIGPSVYTVFGTLVSALVGLPIVLKLLPHVPYLNALVMESPADEIAAAKATPASRLNALKEGMLGVAMVDCRPSGVAKFGDNRFDVVSDGRYIEKGAFVMIKEVTGSRVVVEPKPLDAV